MGVGLLVVVDEGDKIGGRRADAGVAAVGNAGARLVDETPGQPARERRRRNSSTTARADASGEPSTVTISTVAGSTSHSARQLSSARRSSDSR